MVFDVAKSGLVFALALALIGCGSDDDDDDTGAGGSSGSGGSSATGGGSGSGGSSATGGGSGSGGSSATGGSGGSSATGGGGGSDSGGSGGSSGGGGQGGGGAGTMSFFVTSDTSPTGDLGGLAAADQRCQTLAQAVGAGDKTWHAYLSAANDPDNPGMPAHAGQRIGDGPWFNAAGVMLAADLAGLHALVGNPELFLDETGQRINGQWAGSPGGNEHDILTGSAADGTLLEGLTCNDWTSDAMDDPVQVGHSDGLGPGGATTPAFYTSWNSSHESSCGDLESTGGAGKIYCFAID